MAINDDASDELIDAFNRITREPAGDEEQAAKLPAIFVPEVALSVNWEVRNMTNMIRALYLSGSGASSTQYPSSESRPISLQLPSRQISLTQIAQQYAAHGYLDRHDVVTARRCVGDLHQSLVELQNWLEQLPDTAMGLGNRLLVEEKISHDLSLSQGVLDLASKLALADDLSRVKHGQRTRLSALLQELEHSVQHTLSDLKRHLA